MATKQPMKKKETVESDQQKKIKERELHEGPWICDRCGNWARTLGSASASAGGAKRNYDCGCGGKFWPGK